MLPRATARGLLLVHRAGRVVSGRRMLAGVSKKVDSWGKGPHQNDAFPSPGRSPEPCFFAFLEPTQQDDRKCCRQGALFNEGTVWTEKERVAWATAFVVWGPWGTLLFAPKKACQEWARPRLKPANPIEKYWQ